MLCECVFGGDNPAPPFPLWLERVFAHLPTDPLNKQFVFQSARIIYELLMNLPLSFDSLNFHYLVVLFFSSWRSQYYTAHLKIALRLVNCVCYRDYFNGPTNFACGFEHRRCRVVIAISCHLQSQLPAQFPFA